jgi:hypothetical protein
MEDKDKNKSKLIATTRSLVKLNGSLYVCLPKKFVEKHDLKKESASPSLRIRF